MDITLCEMCDESPADIVYCVSLTMGTWYVLCQDCVDWMEHESAINGASLPSL